MIDNTMTAARRRRKRNWPPALLLALGIAAAARPLVAATTEYVVVDRHTGLAISGFDPVFYFTDGAAMPGRAAFEHPFAGAVWRFRNEGNRAAFAAEPDIYMPRFGGYDPIGVTRGIAAPGNPRLWVVSEGRLYLFYTEQARIAFKEDAEAIAAEADRNWPSVQLTLSP